MKNLNKDELLKFLLEQEEEVILEEIEDLHPADILDAIREVEEEKLYYLLSKLPEWVMADVIEEADEEEQFKLLSLFPEIKQAEIVNEMSSDDLADFLSNMEPHEANKLIDKLEKDEADDVKELLAYDPETAGGIMATEFLSINEEMTVSNTLTYLQKEAPDAEIAYYIYVLDDREALKGIVSLRELVTSTFETKIKDVMSTQVKSIPLSMDQEEVAHKFEKYGFLTMPVVDDEGKMMGVITVDDIIEILREEDTEDIHRLAGIDAEESVAGTPLQSIKSRLPWLFINLITAMIASSTVNLFQDTISKVVILASFMPIVAGMGGNAGTQTLTLIVRGIALGDLTGENARKVFFKEIAVGFTNGLSIGCAVALLAGLFSKNMVMGFVIGAAMILNMTAATMAGFLVPVTLKKLKIDPALASAVFVTTVTDVCGFFFFLGLATLFLQYLI